MRVDNIFAYFNLLRQLRPKDTVVLNVFHYVGPGIIVVTHVGTPDALLPLPAQLAENRTTLQNDVVLR